MGGRAGGRVFSSFGARGVAAEGNWYYQEKIGLCSGQERKTHSRKEFICKKVIRCSNRRGLNDFFFFFISLVIVRADRKWKARRVGDGHGK